MTGNCLRLEIVQFQKSLTKMMNVWILGCLVFLLKVNAEAALNNYKNTPNNLQDNDITVPLSRTQDAFPESSLPYLESSTTTTDTITRSEKKNNTTTPTTNTTITITSTAVATKTAAQSETTTKKKGSSSMTDSIEPKPCSAGDSILVTREDAPVGTELLKIPSVHGETWKLKDSGTSGQYLTLEQTNVSMRLIFKQTPDIDEVNTDKRRGSLRETITFYLHCFYRGWTYKYRQKLIIHDVNEHAPVFDMSRPYSISISESSPVGTRAFRLRHLAWDPDVTGRVTGYVIKPYLTDPTRDGRGTFTISDKGNYVILLKPLDFDVMKEHQGSVEFYVNITALDNGQPSPLTSFAVLQIRVTDSDDQGPVFWYPDCPRVGGRCAVPNFQAITKCDYKGPFQLHPGRILAFDQDSINNTILYSIEKVDPEQLMPLFAIGNLTGEVQLMTSSCSLNIKKVFITVKATEDSLFHHSITATLQVDILDETAFSNHRWPINTLYRQDLVGKSSSQHRKNEVAIRNGGNDESHGKWAMGDDDDSESKYTSLPAVFLVLSLLGFVATCGGLAFAGVQLSRRKKTKTTASCARKESGDNTTGCYGCGNDNSFENTSAVTSFAASLSTPTSFINRTMRDSHTENHVLSIGTQDNKDEQSDSLGKSGHFRPGFLNPNEKSPYLYKRKLEEVNDSKRKTFQNVESEKFNSQSEPSKQDQHKQQHQQQLQQQRQNISSGSPSPSPPPPPPPPPCHQQQDGSVFPFSPNLFIQRRSLFQQESERSRQQNEQNSPNLEATRQQNGHHPPNLEMPRQQTGLYPPPPPPPLPPPRPRDHCSEVVAESPSVKIDFSPHLNQPHLHHQQQQQIRRHHLPSPLPHQTCENMDDPWKFLEDSEKTEEFFTDRASPGQSDTSSFMRGSISTSADTMRHDTVDNNRISVKRSTSFKEHLNQMVPQCFNINNLGILSSTSGANSSNSSSNDNSSTTSFKHAMSSFPADKTATNHKVRFDVS